jgi:hypothetical protein
MNKNLVDNNYLIIPNFISAYRSNKLREEFLRFSEDNCLTTDNQYSNSRGFYNYISFLEILCEKTPKVSEVLEETVLPTYAYSRICENGSTVNPHIDGDACEISLILHLGGDNSWKTCIKTPSGQDQYIILNPGDAMIYLGCEKNYWREKYKGNEYVEVSLHYVRSRGDKFYAYFDKAVTNNLENLNDEEDNKIIDKQYSNDDSLNLNDNRISCLNIKSDNKTFINKALKVHGDKYDYSKVNYINSKSKVTIICSEHGEFEQLPDSHIRGFGCEKCSHDKNRKDTKTFISESRLIHGDLYDYSKVDYVNSKTKVTIICPMHGGFEIQPKHLFLRWDLQPSPIEP